MKLLLILFICCVSIPAIAQKKKGNELYESLKLDVPKEEPNSLESYKKRNMLKKITVEYQQPEDSTYAIWYEVFKENKTMEQVAYSIEYLFNLKQKLKIVCIQCNESNAFYNPEKKELVVCYDLLQDMYMKMQKYHTDPDSLGEKIGKAYSFVLYHEIGHALIDLLQIPITGKEEDAADFFAFFILGSSGDDFGTGVCKEGAEFFKDMHDELKTDTAFQRINNEGKIYDVLPYWDEHSFSLQRYYSINSLIFGSNPDKWYGTIDIGMRRPINAIQEFEKISAGWVKVLMPHFRKELLAPTKPVKKK